MINTCLHTISLSHVHAMSAALLLHAVVLHAMPATLLLQLHVMPATLFTVTFACTAATLLLCCM